MLMAVCKREMRARGLNVDIREGVTDQHVSDIDTYRGLERVLNLTFSGAFVTGLIRLCVQEDEFCLYPMIGEERWGEVARNLLEFELNRGDVDVTVREHDTSLDISVRAQDSDWHWLRVPKALGPIADAVVNLASNLQK